MQMETDSHPSSDPRAMDAAIERLRRDLLNTPPVAAPDHDEVEDEADIIDYASVEFEVERMRKRLAVWEIFMAYMREGATSWSKVQQSLTPEDFEREVEGLSARGDQRLSNPEMLISERVLDHEVAAALNALPSDFRTVLMLVDVQELNYQEVAQVLGIPIGTVKSRVSRGRQMMRVALGAFARRRGLVR